MAQTKRSAKLDSKKRLSLGSGKRHMCCIEQGHYLIYQRPKDGSAGSWLARSYDKSTSKQVQVRLGTADDYSDADGDNILTFVQAQGKAKELFKKNEEIKKAAELGEIIATGPYTVEDAINDYIEDGKRRGMKSVDSTVIAARAHIIPTLGKIEVSKLTRAKIESWQSKLSETARRIRSKKGSTSPSHGPDPKTDEEKRARKDTVNRILTILKAALNHSLDREKVVGGGDAWRTTKPFKGVSSARIRFLSTDEQQKLVNACSYEFQLIVQAALFTDLKYGELTKLCKSDYNQESGTIFISESKSEKPRYIILTDEGIDWFNYIIVNKTLDEPLFIKDSAEFKLLVQAALFTGARYGELTKLRINDYNTQSGTIFITESKSGKPRHIILTDEAVNWFNSIIVGKTSDELLFTRGSVKRRARKDKMENQSAWTHQDQQRPMNEACKLAELYPIRFHELRHAYASGLINKGVPLAYIAAQLGHTDTRMVEKHYGHLAPTAMADAIRSLAPKLGIADLSNIQNPKIS